MNKKASLPKDSALHDSPAVKFMPPKFFSLCLGAGVLLELAIPWRLPLPFLQLLIGGLALALGGFWFMMWGHTRFQNLGVNVKTNLPAQSLVLQGAYRYSRNPMYVGFLVIQTGIGLAARSGWLLLAVLPLAEYLRFYVIPREEAYLRRRFGEEYIQYCKKVRRWL